MKSATPRRSYTKLHIERLEPRQLLAGDTYLVNFQNDEATPVTRYLPDIGLEYGDRGGGLFYGWSEDHMGVAHEWSLNPDQRLDTVIHFHAGAIWEFGLPNGDYEVTVSIGDPSATSTHALNVEGVVYWSGISLAANVFDVETKIVSVVDGRLTLDPGAAGDEATRINYVHIIGVAPGGSANSAPSEPAITEPFTNGQIVNPADVHMEVDELAYLDPEGNLHKSTDWEIRTVGPGAETVWQTLGIEGNEKSHTHLGDGIFINSRAGQITLAANTEHELRVRFRDDAGAVSDYSSRLFTTSEANATLPLELSDVLSSPGPTWQNVFATAIDLPGTKVTIPIDADGFGSDSPNNETAPNAVDGIVATKYLNFGETRSGFILTPAVTSSIVTRFQITTANDAEPRDPASYELYGTNAPIESLAHSDGTGESWTLISSGALSLPSARNALGPQVNFANTTAYSSYKMIFPTVKNASSANSMQIAEINFFFGAANAVPPSLQLQAGHTGAPLLTIGGSDAPGNALTHFAPLGAAEPLRVVIQANSKSVNLDQSNLTFRDEANVAHTVFLPAINLTPGQRLDLWVAEDGSTYYGAPLQTHPDFSNLARASDTAQVNPYIALQPGYVIEEVGSDYRLPVNIAFVPNPGPNPNDPLYYVTELYGSIQVVQRDGDKIQFATGLLDYNPNGPISGTGEQGLTGIAVQRDSVNADIYHLYVGMLWNNGAPPGGTNHYPKVERITSSVGGLSMASRTVLLNMQPETQGQSHQISNISIGPDDKLYVHNGDGFDASTALNLDMFRGKVLRMNLDGTAPSDNPFYNASNGITARDYIFAYGLRNPFGGAWRASDGKHYEVENGPSVDRLAQINAGVSYGYTGSDASMMINAIYNWNPSHAPVNITFIQQETFAGSSFPTSKMDHAFVSESGPTYASGPQSRGKRIVEFVLDANGNRISGPTGLIEYRGTGFSSIVGLAAGPDGLYFTELYEDSGAGGPTGVGARIFRVRYTGQAPGDFNYDSNVDGHDFLKWQRTFGSANDLNADANRSGIVDGGDLNVWKGAFGAGAATALQSQSSAANVTLASSTATPVASLAGLRPAGVPNSGVSAAPTVADRRLLANDDRHRFAPAERSNFHDRALNSFLDSEGSSHRHSMRSAADEIDPVGGIDDNVGEALATAFGELLREQL
jgi:glucose/arabinose dehydrogenase